MKKIILLLLVFVRLHTSAQDVNYLTVYHPIINQAELKVIDGEYLDALRLYDSAFTKVEKPFLKDAYNASICATLVGNADATYKNLLRSASRGLSIDFVKDDFSFSAIQKDEAWRDFEKKYLEVKRDFDSKIDKKVKRDLEEMVFLDAKYRRGNIILNNDSTYIIDRGNALRLEKLIKKNGFPGEDLIGIGEGGFPVIQYDFYNILKHQTGDEMTVNFANEVLTAMRQGKINPNVGANIIGTITGSDTFFTRHVFKISTDDPNVIGLQPFTSKIDQWLHRELEPEDEKEFDEIRMLNGMDSLVDYRKKIKFSLNDNRFLFPYRIFAGTWVVNDPELLEQYMDGTVILK